MYELLCRLLSPRWALAALVLAYLLLIMALVLSWRTGAPLFRYGRI